ncbi:MAG: Auxin Efflux Carrier [Cyanobacteria bacterium RYN_339]|nr:Auxin Efflux Carrier [Cyanobacteria bacterium RYN_339]
MTSLALAVAFWMLAGLLLRRAGLVRPEFANDITQLVLWVTLPPLIVTALHGVRLAGVDLAMPALAWGLSLGALGLAHALARSLRLSPARTGSFALAVTFANTTFLGYPLMTGFFPPPAPHLPLAILYDQLGATFAINTIGAAYASSAGGELPTARIVFGRLLRFPPLWGLIVGLLLKDVAIPAPCWTLLTGVGALTIPLMLLCMGLSLRLEHWREGGGLVALAAALKLVLLPLAMWGAVTALGLPPAHAQAAVLEAAMPTMFYALTLAITFRLDVTLVINTIVLSTALAFLTVPGWHALVTR